MRVLTEDQMLDEMRKIPSSGRVVVSGNFATPQKLLDLYDESNQGDWFQPRRIHALNPQKYRWPSTATALETTFVGPGFRKDERLVYVPSRLSLVPSLYEEDLPVDAVFINVSQPAYGERVSLGIECNVIPAAIKACRQRGGKVFALVNRCMPYTFGEAQIGCEKIDYALFYDESLHSPTKVDPDPTSMEIAKNIAELIPENPYLQLGIGAVPDAVLSALKDRDDLSVWSEMISDGVLELDQNGCFANGSIVTSFAFGSPEFYTWLNRNESVRMMRTETTNDPANISDIANVVSINAAMQVDLFGECNASRVHGRIFSGFGGQTDFIVGALHSKRGQSFIALASWHPKADVSTIVPLLSQGFTSCQPTHIVTEYGVATLRGASEVEQAVRLINIAHPDARHELFAHARRMFGTPIQKV